MGLVMEERHIEDVELDPELIHDGDIFLTLGLNGLGPMIMYGTGGRVDHTVTALHIDDELYIVESNDGIMRESGIQKTKWD